MATTLMNDFTTTTQRIHILPSIFTVQDGHTIFDLLIYQIPETGKPCIQFFRRKAENLQRCTVKKKIVHIYFGTHYI